MKPPILTPRLRAAADFVRKNAFVADIGTDHAYLPIALLNEGRAIGAVASDINEGPYLRALENIKQNGLSDKIEAVHTDGLNSIDRFRPSDIVICGMGGELISTIINNAPWTQNDDIRLVLQPMTHPEILRKYLADNGFSIVDEALAKEEKIYQIICAEYSGKNEQFSETELLLGKKNIAQGGEIFCELTEHHINTLEKIIKAKLCASLNADISREDKLVASLKELLKKTEGFSNDGK